LLYVGMEIACKYGAVAEINNIAKLRQTSLLLISSAKPNLLYIMALLLSGQLVLIERRLEEIFDAVSKAVNLSYAMHLHRDPGNVPGADIKRRIFQRVAMADTLCSLMFGRPPFLNPSYCDTKCPINRSQDSQRTLLDYQVIPLAQEALPHFFDTKHLHFDEILRIDQQLAEIAAQYAFLDPIQDSISNLCGFIRMSIHRKFIFYKGHKYDISRSICTLNALDVCNDIKARPKLSSYMMFNCMMVLGMLYAFDPKGCFKSKQVEAALKDYIERTDVTESWQKREVDVIKQIVKRAQEALPTQSTSDDNPPLLFANSTDESIGIIEDRELQLWIDELGFFDFGNEFLSNKMLLASTV